MNASPLRVLVMIAAHNEEENIEHVVRELQDVTASWGGRLPEAFVYLEGEKASAFKSSSGQNDYSSAPPAMQVYVDYLVINDGSTDRTAEICRKNEFQYVNLPVNLGIGGAIQTGYRYARDHGYDIAVQLDGDGQHDPRYLPDVIRPIAEGKADYVIGSRFVQRRTADATGVIEKERSVHSNPAFNPSHEGMSSFSENSDRMGTKECVSPEAGHSCCGGMNDGQAGGKPEDEEGFQSTGARRAGIRFLSGLIRLMCGKKLYDVTSGFRAVGRKSIEAFAENYPVDYPEPEAIINAVLRGERVLEVPVKMREREHGESSINMKRSVYYMIKVSLDIMVCRISYGVRRDPSARKALRNGRK